MKRLFFTSIAFLFILTSGLAQTDSGFSQSEIIYGRKDGMALTMIKLTPDANSNHRGVINVVSGNFISSYDWIPGYIRRSKFYVEHGFTVFLVMHGSQPRYAIPDEINDLKRAVRFIRYNASNLNIDPKKIGITGGSAGGHLSLMIALSDDSTIITSRDPVDSVSARVQAAAVFFPPTDFLNYGMTGLSPLKQKAFMRKQGVAAAFDFKEWNDSTKTYTSITDLPTILKIAKDISPTTYVTSDDPPILIIHGDADPVVPLQQSKLLVEKLNAAHVKNELIIRPGKGHGWKAEEADQKLFLNWFEKYLK
ncbi:MAG: alpha/beta hydrolase [Ginsengibacter sp.]